jgi:hypothetical protein
MNSLDLDVEDDLLDLPGTRAPAEKLYPMLPPINMQLDRCAKFAADFKVGKVKDVDYSGTLPDLQLWTYAELFAYWYALYWKKPNPVILGNAFLAAAKCRAGSSWHKVKSPKLRDWTGRAEAIDASATAVRLLIDLPFDCSRVRPNVENSTHWRAVWFNMATRTPVIPTEPFRIL